MHVRYCPNCRTDYRPEISVCVDCGGDLVDRDDTEEMPGSETETADPGDTLPEGFAPLDYRAAVARELSPIADALLAEGIDCRIRENVHGAQVTGYRIFVHEDHRENAMRIVERATAPEDGAVDLSAGFDPERGYARCPACGSDLAERATECPECGLPLATAQLTCPECGTGLDANADHCSHCGAAIEG